MALAGVHRRVCPLAISSLPSSHSGDPPKDVPVATLGHRSIGVRGKGKTKLAEPAPVDACIPLYLQPGDVLCLATPVSNKVAIQGGGGGEAVAWKSTSHSPPGSGLDTHSGAAAFARRHSLDPALVVEAPCTVAVWRQRPHCRVPAHPPPCTSQGPPCSSTDMDTMEGAQAPLAPVRDTLFPWLQKASFFAGWGDGGRGGQKCCPPSFLPSFPPLSLPEALTFPTNLMKLMVVPRVMP